MIANKINQIESLIAETRLRTEFKITQLRNQQIQAELRAKAVIARQAGDIAGARALEQQLDLQKQIGQQQESLFNMELRNLKLQKGLKDELILQQALQAGWLTVCESKCARR